MNSRLTAQVHLWILSIKFGMHGRGIRLPVPQGDRLPVPQGDRKGRPYHAYRNHDLPFISGLLIRAARNFQSTAVDFDG